MQREIFLNPVPVALPSRLQTTAPVTSPRASLFTAAVRVFRKHATPKRELWQEYRELAELPDRILHDVGLTQYELAAMQRKAKAQHRSA